MMKLQRGIMAALLALGVAAGAQAAPLVSQVGNLLANGNFEAGSSSAVATGLGVGAASALGSWNQYSNSVGTTSEWLGAPLIEGDHVAHVVSGGINDGLYQYGALAGGAYTVSGWVYVNSGAVRLGVAWNSGSNASFGSSSSGTGSWQYLVTTVFGVAGSNGGALIYGDVGGGDYYVDGLWLNAGETNLSPFDPARGFVLPGSGPSGTPLPGSLVLTLGGLALLAARGRHRSST